MIFPPFKIIFNLKQDTQIFYGPVKQSTTEHDE